MPIHQVILFGYKGDNTDEGVSYTVYAAVYDKNNVMKFCGAEIAAYGDTGVDIEVSCEINDTDIIKLYKRDKDMILLALSKWTEKLILW